MDELMKSLEGAKDSRQESGPPKEVNGVLAIHVKKVRLVPTSEAGSDIDPSMAGLMQLRVIVCDHTKIFTLSSCSQEDDTVVCDQLKHFIVELPLKTNSPSNFITVEMVICSPLLPGRASILGRASLYIHDIIQACPVSGHCQLKHTETCQPVASVVSDWAFCYGRYGFGESYQLQDNDRKLGESLHFSLFPRLSPNEARTDNNSVVLMPRPTKHPSFIPFTEHAHLCVQQDSTVKDAHSSPRLLMGNMTRLRSLHARFKTQTDRLERLKFLENLVISSTSCEDECSAGTGVTARKAT